MDGINMNRVTLVLVPLLLCGCAGRVKTDLLQARIREQSAQLAESQRETTRAKNELKQSQRELERLQSEIKQVSAQTEDSDVAFKPNTQIGKVQIYPLASGGINKDSIPGDDAIVVQFAPLDLDNEPFRLAGDVEIDILDPELPPADQEIGSWSFSAEECRSRWTRGITSTGFQFTLPLEQPLSHSKVVVKLRFQPSKDRTLEATQMVKVMPTSGEDYVHKRSRPKGKAKVLEAGIESLPPIEPATGNWGDEGNSETKPARPRKTTLHSSNWTEDTIPVLR